MTTMASKLSKEHLEQIAEYIAKKFPAVRGERSAKTSRSIRSGTFLEEELKNQRELMMRGFEQMDRRFEQIDKRFEQVDKRFELMEKRFEQVDKRFEDMRSDFTFRFEQVDKRFEDMNRRFTMMMWFSGLGFTMVTAFITGAMALMR